MLGHTGLGPKLQSDFKVLGVGGGRVGAAWQAFAEVDFGRCCGTGLSDLSFIHHLLHAIQVFRWIAIHLQGCLTPQRNLCFGGCIYL